MEEDCQDVRRKIANSKANAGSNVGNFLLGMLEHKMEDMACSY